MKHRIPWIVLSFIASLFFTHEIVSQDRREAVQARSRRDKGPDIDMFMGNWKDAKPRLLHGSLNVYDMLTKCTGDPLKPDKKGAVLTDIERISYALLAKGKTTDPAVLDDVQQVFYIDAGEGTISAGGDTADLMEGIGVIMPPGLEFVIANTGGDDLGFYIIEEPLPADFRPVKRMIVHYEYDNPISTNVQRVNNHNYWLLTMFDGLSTIMGINPVMNEPKSFFPLHTHEEGIEEVWISLHGNVMIQIGLQRRKLPAGTAYKVPADGKTPHTNFNTTKTSQKLLWIMKIPIEEPIRKKKNGVI